jgi:hypothetical protein
LAATQTTKLDKETTTLDVLSDRFVQIKLEYLPDFSEEYSITVRPGLGTNNTKITLKDGWNLTQLDQDLDSQVDENVKAIAELAKSVGSIATSASPEVGRAAGPDIFVVPAANIPLGYYESVIGRDPCGRKQMYGWRYVGFAPFNGCPSNGHGSQCIDCHTDLYGLVFRNGVMTFAPLAETPAADNVVIKQQSQESNRTTSTTNSNSSLESSIQNKLKENGIDATVSMNANKKVTIQLSRPFREGEQLFVSALATEIVRQLTASDLSYQVQVIAP